MAKQVPAQIKNGGPYTQREQEERKIQVYHLHFEENKSAVKIAELLSINRNTINDDIRYWHLQLANEMKAQNLTVMMIQQIQRMEIQRDRLLDDLENVESLAEKISIEKFISEIDNRLVQFFSKMILSGKISMWSTIKPEEINEDEIKDFTRYLVKKRNFDFKLCNLSEENIQCEAIKLTKCDMNKASNFFSKMMNLGLEFCEDLSDDYDSFNLLKFCIMRGYVTKEELPNSENS